MRETYVLRNGELVPKHLAAPLHAVHGSAPNVRPDGMDAVQSMIDGRHYDSKSAYYKSVRAADCEIVGNDRSSFREQRHDHAPPPGLKADIARAIRQLGG